MKKYIMPTTEVVTVETLPMLADSMKVDPSQGGNGQLSRRHGRHDIWDDEDEYWDEEEEELY